MESTLSLARVERATKVQRAEDVLERLEAQVLARAFERCDHELNRWVEVDFH
eukprot:CAMPEP_0119533728 /NCGR_PEP_ID=MMETSP1344-20130328/47073_1 /TAXON_ID=236787 /ORGANISM="Florenciella parvula, Strain CCMP2471" /LENGTH=51 /DNA_ID=CAMNT_0007574719 /DNA_START=86 /DNA_END=238 /DNA_ORIENTATION=-